MLEHGDTRALSRWNPTLLLLLFAAVPGVAQDIDGVTSDPEEEKPRRYAVELILFTYADSVSAGGEVFPPDEPPAEDMLGFGDPPVPPDAGPDSDPDREPGMNRDLDAGADEAPVPAFGDRFGTEPAEVELEEIVLPANIELTVLPRESLTLGAEYDKLMELDAYRPVLWTGWSQSTFERDITPTIRVRRLGQVPLSFNGTFQLYLSRFLHLVVDLTLDAGRVAQQVPEYRDARRGFDDLYPGAATGQVRYRIQEDRIMKNGELRYFDHPKFGLLARVTRVEENGSDPAEATEPLPAAPGE